MTQSRAQRSHAVFGPMHYQVLAELVNSTENEFARQLLADHMATFFRKRYPSGFDPSTWRDKTGGKVLGYDIRTGKFAEKRP
jgi:hypothetical protein